MSTRKDKVQIEVEINGQKAGLEVQKLEKKVAQLDKELKELPKGSKEATAKMKELSAATKELDGARPTFGNLKKDAKALARELDQLEEGTDAFIKKSAQLDSVNARIKAVKRNTNGVSKGMNTARLSVGRFGRAFQSLGVFTILATIASMFVNLIGQSQELSKVQRKTDAQMKATLSSTGEVAGRNFEQLKQQATDLQKITLFGDEQTQQAQSLLLTFTKVRGEIFDQSIPAIQDYATAMATASGESTDLKAASIQVGKALNDPIRGMSALSKSGVTFSEDQKKVIKTLQDTGDIAGAQAIILKELETQFGGSAEAAAKAAGTFEQTKNKFADLLEQLGDFFVDFLDFISPALDFIIGNVSKFFTVISDAAKEIPAVFSGVKSAIQQVGIDIKSFLGIGELTEQEKEYAEAGRTIGDAFAQGYGEAVDERTKLNAQKQAQQDAQLAAKQRENALAEAEAAKKQAADLAAAKAKESEKFQKEQLARAKAAFEKENLLAESARIKGEDTQAEYDAQIVANKIDFYRKQLALLTAFGEEESNKFLEIQNKLLGLTTRNDTVVAPIKSFTPDEIVSRAPSDTEADIVSDEERETELLRAKFERALIAEQEYEIASIELKEASIARRLALLAEKGEEETTEYLKLQNDLLHIQNEKETKELDNTARTQEIKQKLLQDGVKAAGALLDLGLEFLKKDEASRKKNASVIKAFETAKVGTNLASEISSIWKNANANPANALIPGFAQGLAIAQTVGASARAGLAVQKIQNQKFAAGGFTGAGAGMPDSTGFKLAGFVHEGEFVMPKWMVEHPVYGQIAANLDRIRTNGYAGGGLVTANTTPSASVAPALNQPMPGAAMSKQSIDKFADAVDKLTSRPLMAKVVYDDFKDMEDEAQASELNSGI